MIVNYWGALLRWDDGAVAAAADEQRGHANDISSAYEGVVSAVPPIWVGDAANAAGADRELMAVRIEKLAGVVNSFADIASGVGNPIRSERIAELYAPTARNPPWPREIWPVYPTRMFSPTAPMTAMRMRLAWESQ